MTDDPRRERPKDEAREARRADRKAWRDDHPREKKPKGQKVKTHGSGLGGVKFTRRHAAKP